MNPALVLMPVPVPVLELVLVLVLVLGLGLGLVLPRRLAPVLAIVLGLGLGLAACSGDETVPGPDVPPDIAYPADVIVDVATSDAPDSARPDVDDTTADVDDTTADVDDTTADVDDDAPDVDDTAADVVADTAPDVPDVPEPPLDDRPGLGARLVALELDPAAPAPVAVLVDVTADDLAFELGAEPSFYTVPAPGDAALRARVRQAPFTIAPGQRLDLDPAPLLAWVPGATALDLAVAAVAVDGTPLATGDLHFTAGDAPVARVAGPHLRVVVHAETGAAPLPADARVGFTLDGSLAPTDLAALVSGPLALKVYDGARRWLLRPGCESTAACAEGGASYPCVSTCACHCGADACDCDLAGLEADMEATAWASARRIVGAASNDDPALARVRIHWVFKRSLGGTASCDVSGELDVDPETYGRFFAAATLAAVHINARAGFRLIDLLSPMNEANHPLQDGVHRNAAGHPSLGGFLSFVELIRQASCSAGRCCAPDRYIVADPDVPALLAAALAAAEPVVAAAADPALAPEVAASLYLDVEQVDPLQLGADDLPPSIVTPVAPFSEALAAALAGRAFPDRTLVVDTYPGSWGAPWFETDDRVVHHMDPATRRIVRVDPVLAADQAVARATRAADDFGARFGVAPVVVLGEVGWSTFDGDEPAQAAFARRLFDAAAARRATDPRFGGFLWFKTKDRSTFAYPSWTEAANPLGGDPVACDDSIIGAIVCAAAVLDSMEGQWGLRRVDGAAKPGWSAFVARWQRHAGLSAGPGSSSDR